MNVYLIVMVVVAIAILMINMTRGAKKGFGKELAGILAILAAGAVILVVSGMIREFMQAQLSSAVSGFVLLALLGLFYKIFNMFFCAFDLITGLPIVKWLDTALGFVLGLIEGFFVLCALQYILEFYLLL